MEAYAYQQTDIDRIVSEGHKSAFIAYEMALGKTFVAVELAKAWGSETVVVICPVNTFRSWEKTIRSQIPGAEIYFCENTPAAHARGTFTKIQERAPGFFIIGWEMMRTGAITGAVADLVIADEVHRIQNYGGSATSQTIRWIDSEYKIALSGTPAANRPEGLFSPINWLWPKKYKSYHRWIEDFWRTIRDGAVIKLVRELRPGGVIADLPLFIRRLKKDHRGDLPPVMPPIELVCPMTPAQRKIYKQFDDLALAWLGDHPVATSNPLVQELRLRQLTLGVPIVVDGVVTFAENCKSSKLDSLIALIKDGGDDETWFVLSPSSKFIPVVVARLKKAGISAEAFMGGQSKKERDRKVEEFGTTFRVMVAATAAVAEGLDGLQHKCSNGVTMSKHASALINTQAGERLDRPGQTTSVQWWNMIAPDTKDESAEMRLEDIKDDLTALYDTY